MALFTLKKIPAKFILIGFLIVLILLLALISLISKKQKPTSLNPSFSPSFIGFPQNLPSASVQMSETERGDPYYYEEINRQILAVCPLYPYLPYETNQYKIKCSGDLQITVFLKNATPSAALKQEVNDWILSKGIDPSTHQIIFK